MLSATDLFAFLEARGIDHVTTDHAPRFHVGDSAEVASLPGAHTKNLFLKDAKSQLWLVSALQTSVIDLKALPRAIGSARLSFGSASLMEEALGVTPGSVTAFALVNDTERRVRFVIDRALWVADEVNFHPLVNTATTRVSREGLRRFLDAVTVTPIVVSFLPPAPRATM